MQVTQVVSESPCFHSARVCFSDGAVGKTCLLLMYVEDKYEPKHIPTSTSNGFDRPSKISKKLMISIVVAWMSPCCAREDQFASFLVCGCAVFDNKAKRITCQGKLVTLTLWDTAGVCVQQCVVLRRGTTEPSNSSLPASYQAKRTTLVFAL